MTRKILTVVLLVLTITISLGLNIYLYLHGQSWKNKLERYSTLEEGRLKESTASLALFSFPLSNNHTIFDTLENIKSSKVNDDLLKFSKVALDHLQIAMDDILTIQGGLDPETGQMVNPYSVDRINYYFYGNNELRPFSIKYVLDPILAFKNRQDDLGLNSSLKKPIKYQQLLYPKRLFKDLTAAEAVMLINLIKSHIYYDLIVNLERTNEG